MSEEEKEEMMNKMMDKFFADITSEEKEKMMEEMMPKMMKNMMSEGKSGCEEMFKMMGEGKEGKMSMMPQMMTEMMPRCLKMMLPNLPKEKRIDFVLNMVRTLVEQGSNGMSAEEKKDFVAKVAEKVRL
ncbi:MAG: hypothetical protein JSV97_06130 [candidate division WOR-3 bacterium]|nr:MAG: hypothetical protein JSV97_06130 [candidate division WOR-3 bacterium]